jgi:hypothetical protein
MKEDMRNWQTRQNLVILGILKRKKKEKKKERMVVGFLWKVGIVVGL